jgi:archaellum biogenesis protein FlaJ (TadC family)
MNDWILSIGWMALLTVVMLVASMLLVWIIIIRLPADYLTHDRQHESVFSSQRTLIRITLIVVKNLAGLLLVVAGIIMLLTPGQGLLCILAGLILIDFKGKHRVIRRMLGHRRVLATINSIRTKAQKPPLEVSTTGSEEQ